MIQSPLLPALRLSPTARVEVIRRCVQLRARQERHRDRRGRPRASVAYPPRDKLPHVMVSAQSRMTDADFLLADVRAGAWERRKP